MGETYVTGVTQQYGSLWTQLIFWTQSLYTLNAQECCGIEKLYMNVIISQLSTVSSAEQY